MYVEVLSKNVKCHFNYVYKLVGEQENLKVPDFSKSFVWTFSQRSGFNAAAATTTSGRRAGSRRTDEPHNSPGLWGFPSDRTATERARSNTQTR